MGDEDIGSWKPPNEAELKVLEARRERNDQISRLMANYMLKGYRMLDRVCALCQTVLLQRGNDGDDYCVACHELGSETAKDDPAVSQQAAAQAVLEQQQRKQRHSESPGKESVPEGGGDGDKLSESEEEYTGTGTFATGTEETTTTSQEEDLTANCDDEPTPVLHRSVNYTEAGGVQLVSAYFRLKAKIDKLSKQLVNSNGLAESREICDAIKVCAETALSIKKLL